MKIRLFKCTHISYMMSDEIRCPSQDKEEEIDVPSIPKSDF